MTAPTLVAGCMTGTSLDALDIAIVEIRGDGLSLAVKLRHEQSFELGQLAEPLRHLAFGGSTTIENLCRLRAEFSHFHAAALNSLPECKKLDLISVHGQTLFHRPPLSYQLIDAAIIAHHLQRPVVYDLRAADLACGGEGAPITPLADCVLFWKPGLRTAVVNLGGFCNITLLPASGAPGQIEAFDLCACNQLLDHVARSRLDQPYDRNGETALGGAPQPMLVETMVRHFAGQSTQRRSLGSGDEMTRMVDACQDIPASNLLASICLALARHMAQAIGVADEIILAGGGAHNGALLKALTAECRGPVRLSSAHGIPISARESMAMAVLGHLCKIRIPITLPQVTRVKEPPPISGHFIHP